ncbi:hypothetical protein GCM10023214_40190 [Amycolatopsis dongchuanensis]|uniref:Uncharacterized protein n=1 Tax=Amycolatopsis dongchuanensis TaxID=1070866 RepID=A0ABP9QSJ2_9PSEU
MLPVKANERTPGWREQVSPTGWWVRGGGAVGGGGAGVARWSGGGVRGERGGKRGSAG